MMGAPTDLDELIDWIRPRVHLVHGIRWTTDQQWSTRLILPYTYENVDFRRRLLSESISDAADFVLATPTRRRWP